MSAQRQRCPNGRGAVAEHCNRLQKVGVEAYHILPSKDDAMSCHSLKQKGDAVAFHTLRLKGDVEAYHSLLQKEDAVPYYINSVRHKASDQNG
jgi:hypothetical protein